MGMETKYSPLTRNLEEHFEDFVKPLLDRAKAYLPKWYASLAHLASDDPSKKLATMRTMVPAAHQTFGDLGGITEWPEDASHHPLQEKFVVDSAGDECFILDEFYYYVQHFLTLRGLYHEAYLSLTSLHSFDKAERFLFTSVTVAEAVASSSVDSLQQNKSLMRQRIKSVVALAKFYNGQGKYLLARDLCMSIMDAIVVSLSFHFHLDKLQDNDTLKQEKRRRCKVKIVRRADAGRPHVRSAAEHDVQLDPARRTALRHRMLQLLRDAR